MLTLIAYRFAIDANLPKVSYLTRMDYFILLSTILVYASLIEVIITSTFAKNEKLSQARALDRQMRCNRSLPPPYLGIDLGAIPLRPRVIV